MTQNYKEHIILENFTIREAMARLDKIGVQGNVLFIVNETGQMLGTVSDGDIRRGLMKDLDASSLVINAANKNFSFTEQSEEKHTLHDIGEHKKRNIRLLPQLDKQKNLLQIINLDNYRGFLPLDVVIMAGGKGSRLMPLTKDCPKPMLKIGSKPIIEHNIDRLISYGITNFTISINYLGDIIEEHFGDGSAKGVSIKYVKETHPLGTLGSISLVPKYFNDYVLVMNSDLLTDIDYLDFFEEFSTSNANLSVASIPYHVDIPYAVLEIDDNNCIQRLTEKPKYTYYSNAGIYLVKKSVLSLVPHNEFYNATDLIDAIIANGGKVNTFPILSYWLDIGKMPDYVKAQEDIKHLKL